jgi:predicted dehydrogenase
VVQVGTQRRSAQVLREAVEYVRSGGLGPVTVAKCYDIQNEWPNGIGRPPDEPPPTDWEWDQWLGPAPWVPYNRNRAFYNFRWFYDYSGGQLTNFGVHFMDVIRWILALEWPRKVTAIGGHYAVKDNREIPDTLEVVWEFDGPTLVTFSQIDANAAPANLQSADMELRGTKGTMYIHLDRWEVVPEAITEMEKGAGGWRGGAYSTSKKPVIEPKIVRGNVFADLAHVRNFLDCVKSRARCNADALTGHVSTATVLLGNIALRTESLLKWDGLGERFTNNPAANSLLHYQYRAPYKLG